MATLYGNEPALQAAKLGSSTTTAGETFALVTWKQKADESWFGANIPDEVQSIEQISTGGDVKEMHRIENIKFIVRIRNYFIYSFVIDYMKDYDALNREIIYLCYGV